MKAYGRSWGIAPSFSTSALEGGKWSASRSCHFASGLGCRYPWIGGWVGPQSRSGRHGIEKHLLHLPGIEEDYNFGSWIPKYGVITQKTTHLISSASETSSHLCTWSPKFTCPRASASVPPSHRNRSVKIKRCSSLRDTLGNIFNFAVTYMGLSPS
jgi:hypothetical protein